METYRDHRSVFNPLTAVLCLFVLVPASTRWAGAADASPTNSLTVFGPRPIFVPGAAMRVIVDDFGWIDHTLTPQKLTNIAESIAEWNQEGLVYGAYYANGDVESEAANDPQLREVACAVTLRGLTNDWMVFIRRGFRDYLIESGKLAIDLGATYFFLDNAAPELGTLSFDAETVAGFRDYLTNHFSSAELTAMGVSDITTFDYRLYLRNKGYGGNPALRSNPPNDALWDAWLDYIRGLEREFFVTWTTALREYARTNYNRSVYFGANRYINARQWDNLDVLDFGLAETFLDSLGYPYATLDPIYKTIRNFGKRFWSWNFPANTPELNGNSDPYDPIRPGELDKVYIAETLAAGGLVQIPIGWTDFHIHKTSVAPFMPYFNFPARHPDLFNLPEDGQVAVLYSEADERLNELQSRSSFRGAVYLLADLHWPYDVVFAADPTRRDGSELLTLEQLQKYDAVILPDSRHLADRHISLLEQYVNGGGTLIGMGVVATYDENGDDVSNTRTFDDLFGADAVRTLGSGTVVSLTTNYGSCYSADLSDTNLASTIRAAFVSQVGSYITPEVTLSHLSPADTYEAELPYVHLQRYRSADGSSVIHLVNRRVTLGSTAEDHVLTPLSSVQMTVAIPDGFDAGTVVVSFVSADQPTPQTLNFTVSGNQLTFALPTFDVWAVVKIGSTKAPMQPIDTLPHSNAYFAEAIGVRQDARDADGNLLYNYWYWKGGNHGSIPWDVPYFATDDQGLSEVRLFYRYSPDYVTWTDWKPYATNAVSGQTVYDAFSFDAPDGEGHYQFYTQAVDGNGNVEVNLPWAEQGFGADTTGPNAPSNVVASTGIQSGYWTTDLTELTFQWDPLTDNLSGVSGLHVGLVDSIGTPHAF